MVTVRTPETGKSLFSISDGFVDEGNRPPTFVGVRDNNPKETEKMNNELYMIGTAILVLLGLAKSTRKAPRFERRERTEREGVIINWLTVKVGSVLKIDVTNFIVAKAKDIARPMPLAAPDTSATRPERLNICVIGTSLFSLPQVDSYRPSHDFG